MEHVRYELRAVDGAVLLSAQELAELEVCVAMSLCEPDLRRRVERLSNHSLRHAIHAMLDNEEPDVLVRVSVWQPLTRV